MTDSSHVLPDERPLLEPPPKPLSPGVPFGGKYEIVEIIGRGGMPATLPAGSWVVYVLYSASRRRHYTGYAQDLPRRIEQHNQGSVRSTRSGIPWALVHAEVHGSRSSAARRERYLKSGFGRKWLKRRQAGGGSAPRPRGRNGS